MTTIEVPFGNEQEINEWVRENLYLFIPG